MGRNRILIIDDDPGIRFVIREILEEEGFYVDEAADGEEGIKKISQIQYDLAVVDIYMPHKDGFAFLKEARSLRPELISVVITAYGSHKVALDAIREGAYDYFAKPFDNDELKIVIKRVLDKRRLEQHVKLLQEQLTREQLGFGEMIGSTSEMKEIFSLIRRVSSSNATVVIYGESGTGKELVARAIHRESPRKDKAFMKVNCAAIPETLLESELFGYERGAFTGAYNRKPGKFEIADQGTIFLDEIGDMPLSIQAKVLRLIEQREFERLGSTETISVDVRIITATNKDLLKCVKDGVFREDLYFRINVVPIYVPPLRARKNDISLLIDHFIQRFNNNLGKNIKGVTQEVMDMLLNHPWQGNVRELENTIQRAMIMATGDFITTECMPTGFITYPVWSPMDMLSSLDDFSEPLSDKLQRISESLEKVLIQNALEKANYRRQKAAEILGISRKSLHNKMVKYRLFDK